MTKRLIDVDDDLLARARLTLGTETLKETVNSALAVVVGDRHERVKAALDHFARLAQEGALHDRSEAWG